MPHASRKDIWPPSYEQMLFGGNRVLRQYEIKSKPSSRNAYFPLASETCT
jgi:hypothetical protein